jgi:hypothetical protein
MIPSDLPDLQPGQMRTTAHQSSETTMDTPCQDYTENLTVAVPDTPPKKDPDMEKD